MRLPSMWVTKIVLVGAACLLIASCASAGIDDSAITDPAYTFKRVDDTLNDWPWGNQEISYIKNCALANSDTFEKLSPRLHNSISRLDEGTNCNLAQVVAGGAVADLNNDGNLDIVETHPTLGNMTIWLGDGSGGFSKGRRTSYLGETSDYGAAG